MRLRSRLANWKRRIKRFFFQPERETEEKEPFLEIGKALGEAGVTLEDLSEIISRAAGQEYTCRYQDKYMAEFSTDTNNYKRMHGSRSERTAWRNRRWLTQ